MVNCIRLTIWFWHFIRTNPKALFGLIILFPILIAAIAASILTWHPPLRTLVSPPLMPPNYNNPFGTDDLGRDIYSNVVYGARTSLFVGATAVIISMFIGIMFGSLAGYYRRLDDLLMRVTDLFLVIPRFVLALVIVAIFGQTLLNIILVIAVVSWPGFARIIRAEYLSIRERPFVEAVKALGAKDRQIIFREILPNAIPPLVPYSALETATAILIEAGLSFLGVGDPNVASWGYMLNNAQQYLRIAWWMAFFPGLTLLLTVLGLNLLGDAINEYINPRLRKR